jgi:hypothetical protein
MLEQMRPLTDEEKEDLEIELPTGEIYIIELDRVIEERCDELDYILEDHGHEILHRDYKTLATNIYHYKVIFR